MLGGFRPRKHSPMDSRVLRTHGLLCSLRHCPANDGVSAKVLRRLGLQASSNLRRTKGQSISIRRCIHALLSRSPQALSLYGRVYRKAGRHRRLLVSPSATSTRQVHIPTPPKNREYPASTIPMLKLTEQNTSLPRTKFHRERAKEPRSGRAVQQKMLTKAISGGISSTRRNLRCMMPKMGKRVAVFQVARSAAVQQFAVLRIEVKLPTMNSNALAT